MWSRRDGKVKGGEAMLMMLVYQTVHFVKSPNYNY